MIASITSTSLIESLILLFLGLVVLLKNRGLAKHFCVSAKERGFIAPEWYYRLYLIVGAVITTCYGFYSLIQYESHTPSSAAPHAQYAVRPPETQQEEGGPVIPHGSMGRVQGGGLVLIGLLCFVFARKVNNVISWLYAKIGASYPEKFAVFVIRTMSVMAIFAGVFGLFRT